MFGAPNSPTYSKLEQGERGEEESQPLHYPRFNPYNERSERPWLYFLKLLCKATVCLLATYGIYCALYDIGIFGNTPNSHSLKNIDLDHKSSNNGHNDDAHAHDHDHAHDHNSHITTSPGKQHPQGHEGPVLHDDGYVTWPDTRSCYCGATVEEALANDCKFDSHALAWLPPHCRDDELTAEFEKLGPRPDGSWELYATHDRSQPLYFANISLVPGTKFYMTMEWHDMHCAYTWRKLYRSRVLGITMDRKSDGLHHVGHCTNEFLRRADLQDLTTRATIDLDADHPVKEDEE